VATASHNCCLLELYKILLLKKIIYKINKRFYTQTLPVSYQIDQSKILFWKKLLNCDNIAVRTVAAVNRHSIGLIMSKYKLQSISTNVSSIK